MDVNAKVEELVKLTTSLKNDVKELKVKDANTRLDELEKEREALKQDILDLRHNLMRQNEKILRLIRQQNDKLVETIETNKLAPQLVFSKKVSKYSKLFPIKSLQELDELEQQINDNNINEMTAVVHQLLGPKGILKNIIAVMSQDCIMECNVDGHHNKRRLLNSPKFMNLLFQGSYCDGYSQKLFLEHVRRAFKMVKNRYYKNLCNHRNMLRQRQLEIETQLVENLTDEIEMQPDDYIKQEKEDIDEEVMEEDEKSVTE